MKPTTVPFGNQARPDCIANRPLICCTFYGRKHRAPECALKMNQHEKVVENYERLTAEENAGVSDKQYIMSLQFVNGRPEQELWKEVEKAAAPEY